jgi:hypothetical protein
MKTAEKRMYQRANGYVQKSSFLLILIAGLLMMQTAAWARDGRAIAAAGGARWGYNNANAYGYWYGPTPAQRPANSSGRAASTLPPGYLAKLPDGAVSTVIFGKQYYWANGTDYSAVMYGGRTVYVVANP